MISNSFCYAIYSGATWDSCELSNCEFKEAFFSEMTLKKVKFKKVDFSGADFFKTQLKGIDLSSCEIQGIMVSDTYKELQGLKIGPVQAMDIARLVGVKIL